MTCLAALRAGQTVGLRAGPAPSIPVRVPTPATRTPAHRGAAALCRRGSGGGGAGSAGPSGSGPSGCDASFRREERFRAAAPPRSHRGRNRAAPGTGPAGSPLPDAAGAVRLWGGVGGPPPREASRNHDAYIDRAVATEQIRAGRSPRLGGTSRVRRSGTLCPPGSDQQIQAGRTSPALRVVALPAIEHTACTRWRPRRTVACPAIKHTVPAW